MIMTPDAINGVFEFLGALFVWLSIAKLRRDQLVRGVSWIHVGFIASWGLWNLYYYTALDQWLSLAGAVAMLAMNTLYLGLLIWYTIRERTRHASRDMD